MGSTILIFHGSAQLRRPACWPIVLNLESLMLLLIKWFDSPKSGSPAASETRQDEYSSGNLLAQ